MRRCFFFCVLIRTVWLSQNTPMPCVRAECAGAERPDEPSDVPPCHDAASSPASGLAAVTNVKTSTSTLVLPPQHQMRDTYSLTESVSSKFHSTSSLLSSSFTETVTHLSCASVSSTSQVSASQKQLVSQQRLDTSALRLEDTANSRIGAIPQHNSIGEFALSLEHGDVHAKDIYSREHGDVHAFGGQTVPDVGNFTLESVDDAFEGAISITVKNPLLCIVEDMDGLLDDFPEASKLAGEYLKQGAGPGVAPKISPPGIVANGKTSCSSITRTPKRRRKKKTA